MTSRKKIVYIAGPMTGLRGFNRDSFSLAELAIKAQGHEVRNPACLPCGWSEYEDYIAVGLTMLGQCDTIVFLPGSEKSPGAKREAQRAIELGVTCCASLVCDVWRVLEQTYRNNGGAL